MTREEVAAKVQALWPEHTITGLPMSAQGVLKILEAVGLLEYSENKKAKEPQPEKVAAAVEEATEVVAEVKPEEEAPVVRAPTKKKTKNEG